jgi:hypothetical protein
VAPPPAPAVAASAPPVPVPPPSATPSAQELASRGLSKELAGDRAGAIVDLQAALARETDAERRKGIENLLRLLEEK